MMENNNALRSFGGHGDINAADGAAYIADLSLELAGFARALNLGDLAASLEKAASLAQAVGYQGASGFGADET